MVEQLIAGFWNEVKNKLARQHHVEPAMAHKWVNDYRRILRSHRVGSAIFNRGADAAAATIYSAIKAGHFPPDPEQLQNDGKSHSA